ncbi:competence protein ComJ [Escherichia albertii]|uniref:competence protein ComJ n=1 Tax=Escherichia albertii TaxID=208962 RepID=UPI001F494C46|nr:competence protein ComJ [Escherichia albertii]
MIKEQCIDLLISHNQILIRSRAFDENVSQWGKGNIAQGAIVNKDYVIFDPLPEDAFGANVILSLVDEFIMDENCQRCIVVPFTITDKNTLEVASATEKFKIELILNNKSYSLYYEICEGDEIYYKFTFVNNNTPVESHFLIDDSWGGVKGKSLNLGMF